MRKAKFLLGLALPAILAGSAAALERASARADAAERDSWITAQSCTVRYYNNCTGWVWVWSGWSPGEAAGTAFHGCCDQAVLQLTHHLTFSGVPSSWGFTGTIEVYEADAAECPTGPPLASQPWLPPVTSGWQTASWSIPVPRDFIVRMTMSAPTGFSNSTGIASDHPLAGPTGPTACGLCFPSDRAVHSYRWQPGASPCAGVFINDGLCDVELMADAQLSCTVHVESRTWGKIKTLYR